MPCFASSIDAPGCAVGIQQAIERHNRREAKTRMSVRVGLHVGEPIRDEDDYFGTPVVVAKRLCDRAEGGQILASDVVRALVGTRGGFRFSPERLFSRGRRCDDGRPVAPNGLNEAWPLLPFVRWAVQRIP